MRPSCEAALRLFNSQHSTDAILRGSIRAIVGKDQVCQSIIFRVQVRLLRFFNTNKTGQLGMIYATQHCAEKKTKCVQNFLVRQVNLPMAQALRAAEYVRLPKARKKSPVRLVKALQSSPSLAQQRRALHLALIAISQNSAPLTNGQN